MGFRVPQAHDFHPFLYEILSVQARTLAEDPIQITAQEWPPLMLGTMIFCRGGTVVSGGSSHVVKEFAERSKMYWTYWRKDRTCDDLSHGWGSNSQWRTRFRRDYQSPDVFYFNIDGDKSLNERTGTAGGPMCQR